MYFLLGIALTLAFLMIVNMIVALAASCVWRVISRSVERFSVNARAQIIYGLRVLPVAASLVFVGAFLVPSYLLHEPESSGEVVSGKLGFIAAISSLGVIIAIYRVFKTWLATRRLTANWLNNAVEIKLEEIRVPSYKIKHPFPVIAVIGIFRPRMFVAEQVLDSLDKNEFDAAVAHEHGHLKRSEERRVGKECA